MPRTKGAKDRYPRKKKNKEWCDHCDKFAYHTTGQHYVWKQSGKDPKKVSKLFKVKAEDPAVQKQIKFMKMMGLWDAEVGKKLEEKNLKKAANVVSLATAHRNQGNRRSGTNT